MISDCGELESEALRTRKRKLEEAPGAVVKTFKERSHKSNTCHFVFDLIVEFLGGTGFCLFDYRLVFAPLCILPMLHALCHASLEPKSKKSTSHGAFQKFGA